MNTEEWLRSLDALPYFTIQGLKLLADIDEEYARVLVHRWQKRGWIFPLKRGLYLTRRFYENYRHEENFLAALSSILLSPSYVSLEFVLQRHQVLTEVTYPITGITPKNTRRIINPFGVYWFRHIKQDFYEGFSVKDFHGIRFSEASLAKALFDYLYLKPLPTTNMDRDFDLAEELRLNLDSFSKTAKDEFAYFVEKSSSPKMKVILDNLWRNPWRP